MRSRRSTLSGLRVAVVACESSGDVLGAGLLDALRARLPDARFFGMAGQRMIEAGCEAWHHIDEVSVMGLAEVLPHLPRLLRMRRRLGERLAGVADLFIGIDSPAFNLPLAGRLKAGGIPAVQYVSPQVWAWRQSRVSGIRAATDLVLCVLPFEADFLREHGVAARFVGHPLADVISADADPAAARAALGADTGGEFIAVLPGSRRSEVARLAVPFLQTARWLSERRPELRFGVALASPDVGRIFEAALRDLPLEPEPLLVTGQSRRVMAAADVVLTASGTATLEALLLNRRMVVAHKISPVTYWLVRRMGVARLPHFSLPNLLAGRNTVPEFVQRRVRADTVGPCLLEILEGRGMHPDWQARYASTRAQLRNGASEAAADAVLELLGARA